LRSLGDVSAGNGQPETVNRAIEQYREINRLDPSDTESALWLAPLPAEERTRQGEQF